MSTSPYDIVSLYTDESYKYSVASAIFGAISGCDQPQLQISSRISAIFYQC